MSPKPFICALAIALVCLTAAAQDLTVDQIIAKNIEAHGGLEKIKAQKTLRFSGRMTLGPGLEAPAVMEQKRPGSFRLEITLQGLTAVQAYDGQTGWPMHRNRFRSLPMAHLSGAFMPQVATSDPVRAIRARVCRRAARSRHDILRLHTCSASAGRRTRFVPVPPGRAADRQRLPRASRNPVRRDRSW